MRRPYHRGAPGSNRAAAVAGGIIAHASKAVNFSAFAEKFKADPGRLKVADGVRQHRHGMAVGSQQFRRIRAVCAAIYAVFILPATARTGGLSACPRV